MKDDRLDNNDYEQSLLASDTAAKARKSVDECKKDLESLKSLFRLIKD